MSAGPRVSALAPRLACKCRANGLVAASPRVGRARRRPTARNHVWAYDFVFDACANGQQLKCLTIVDEWTRECLAIDVAGQHPLGPRHRGAGASSSACTARRATCAPTTARSSSSRAILQWLARRRHRHGAHRSRQALAERHRRELQREVPRRVPEHGVVSQPAEAVPSSRPGGGTTTTSVRTRAWTTERRASSARPGAPNINPRRGILHATSGPMNPGRSEGRDRSTAGAGTAASDGKAARAKCRGCCL